MTFQDLQDTIVRWRDAQIKGSTVVGTVAHLGEEVEDLRENPHDPLALADIGILWMSLCEQVGFSMEEMKSAIEAKMVLNESRDWGEADDKGIIRHLKETKI